MSKIKFDSVFANHNLFESMYKDGLVVNKQNPEKYTYVIGIDRSFDSISMGDYSTFTILNIPSELIRSKYNLISKSPIEIELMLLHILQSPVESDDKKQIIKDCRILSLKKFFNIINPKIYAGLDVEKIMIKTLPDV